MSHNTEKYRNNFMVQGAILGMASILVRVIGLIYRVPLNNILGEKGVAYYGVAYDVYSILLLLSSYSMPLAVSKLVSAKVALGYYKSTRKILTYAVAFSLVCGIAAFCITYFLAEPFAQLWNYPQSALALNVLSPALVIMSVLGVLRGFFQGLGSMVPTALSNIIEQIVNAAVSLGAALILYGQTAIFADYTAEARGAAGGTAGTVTGALTALIFMIVLFVIYNKKLNVLIEGDTSAGGDKASQIIKGIVVTILPVIASTTIYNIGSLVDTGLFGNIMKFKGYDADTIATLTGMYTGNYRLIVNVPIALASALASSLIPSVVASMAKDGRGPVIRKVESAIKLTMIVSAPCAVGIGVLSKGIINLLFPSSVDPDKVALMMMIGCVSVILYSISTITNSILQGIDHMRIPVRHSAISLAIHVVILALGLWLTDCDIFCVVVADCLFALTICILNDLAIRRYLQYKQEMLRTFVVPLISSLIMGAATFAVYTLLGKAVGGTLIPVVGAIIAAVIVYIIVLLLLRVLDEEEMRAIPGGAKLAGIARKLHLLR